MSEANDREGVVAERPKTNDGNDREGLLKLIKELKANNDGLAARNKELKARNEELSARNDELESENRVLRGDEGHGDSWLPVVATKTVDLSRVDQSIVAQVASFLCTSRELLKIALTCKAFGWRQPPFPHWSRGRRVSSLSISCNQGPSNGTRYHTTAMTPPLGCQFSTSSNS